MKQMVTTLTERGQVSVPARIRRDMHLNPGIKLFWQEVSERECRLVVQEEASGPGAEAMLGYGAGFRDVRSTESWMRELREGEKSGAR